MDDTPSPAQIWEELGAMLGERWQHATGHLLPVAIAALDSGDGLTTAEVYSFVRHDTAARTVGPEG